MHKLILALIVTAVGLTSPAFSQNTAINAPPPVTAPSETQRVVKLSTLGQANGIQLTGLNRSVSMNAGVRLDELVTAARLDLKVIYPPGMRHDQSFIRVYVNGQLAGMHQLDKTRAGVSHGGSIALDPLLFSDFAGMRIEFDGTYDSTCVDPSNPTLRLDISPDSALQIISKPLALVNDLALLPAPFFDPRDNNRLSLPIVLPSQKTATALKASGVLASWFGAQAFYRQADFKLLSEPSDQQHTVILSTGEKLPRGVTKNNIQGPTLYMDSSETRPWIKHLYILGRNDAELLQAVYGLVLEAQALSGQVALVKKVDLGPARTPYDAPRYVPSNRPVRFAELTDYPEQLEVNSNNPVASLNLRLPPDLFSWAGKNIPMSLKYRYTAPSRWNDSKLDVAINQNLIQSFRLAPRAEQAQNNLGLNLLGQTELAEEEAFQIPAFRVGGSNRLSFAFAFMPEGDRNCAGVEMPARGSIDPESTLDFSDLPHYTRMPNLTAFANGGYPFSVHADLSQTALVLPVNPQALEIKAFLNVMGLFGQWTGLPAFKATVAFSNQLNLLEGKDWIAIGTTDKLGWLDKYAMNLPMVLNKLERSMGVPSAVKWLRGIWQSDEDIQTSQQPKALIQTSGPLGAIMGFESQFNKKRSGVVITGTTADSFLQTVGALSDFGDVAKIRGSVTLVRDQDVQSYNLGSTYINGALPWWLHIRIAFSEYPALIAITGALAGMVLAVLLFGWLSGRSARRTKAS